MRRKPGPRSDSSCEEVVAFNNTGIGYWAEDSIVSTLRCGNAADDVALTLDTTRAQAVAFNIQGANKRKDRPEGGLYITQDETAKSLDTSGANPTSCQGGTAIPFSCKDHGADAGEVAPTLRAMPHDQSHANGGGQIAVAFHENQRGELSLNDTAGALNVGGGKPGQGYPAVAFNLRGREDGSQPEVSEVASIRSASGGSSRSYVATGETLAPFLPQGYRIQNTGGVSETVSCNPAGGMRVSPVLTDWAVRRLSVVECARLQGFPDLYCHIEYGRPRKIEPDEAAYFIHHGLKCWQEGEQWMTSIAADGNMYRALGNSKAVPVVSWLGKRIQASDESLKAK